MGASGDTEANRKLIGEHHDRYNSADLRGAAEDFAPDAMNFGRQVGRELILAVLEDVYATFPDWRAEIVEIESFARRLCVRAQLVRLRQRGPCTMWPRTSVAGSLYASPSADSTRCM